MNNEERNIERRADEEIRADERPLAERTPVPGTEGMPDTRGEAVVMRRKKSFSSNDFVIEDENGDELGAIVEAERKAPRFFRAFRDFDIGGPRIGLRARITRKTLKPQGVRTLYAVVGPDGSPLAEVKMRTTFITKIVIVPTEGKPMEFRMKGLHRFEVVSLESKAKIAAGDFRTRKGVRVSLEFSPGVSSEWQALIMTAALAFDLGRRIRNAFFSSSILARLFSRD